MGSVRSISSSVRIAILFVALAPITAATVTVTDAATLVRAATEAKAGDIILCRGGNYGPVDLTGLRKTGLVVIRAFDRANPPRFIGVSGRPGRDALNIDHCSNLTFEGLRFIGTGLKDAYGYPAGFAIEITSSSDIAVRNCTFDFWHVGIELALSERLLFEYNTFTRRGMDSFRVFRKTDRLTIRRNMFHNDFIDASRSREDPRHPDIVQFAIASSTVEGSTNALLEENRVIIADTYSHCFFLFGNTPPSYHRNITVRGNDITAPQVNAIAFGRCQNVVCTRNRIRISPPNSYYQTPAINFYAGCTGSVTNNVMVWPVNDQEPGALDRITMSGNVLDVNERTLPNSWRDLTGLVGAYAPLVLSPADPSPEPGPEPEEAIGNGASTSDSGKGCGMGGGIAAYVFALLLGLAFIRMSR